MGRAALVTGASGFLGGYTVRELLRHGWDVVAAGRNRAALPGGAEHLVGDLDALAEVELPVDTVVHCAALSAPWGRWSDFEHSNVIGTRRVLDFARRNGVRRIVHVSSPSVYAAARDRIGIREDAVDPRNRLNGYIRSKIAAERLLRAAAAAPGAPEIVMLRPRGLVGAGDPSLVPRLLEVHARLGIPLFGGGRNLIDLTAVENVAQALRLAAETPGVSGEVFNISNGDPRPFRELLVQLLTGLGIAPRFRRMDARAAYLLGGVLEAACRVLPGRPEPPLTRYTVTTIAYSQTLDISRARRMLGYEPVTTLDQSLAAYANG